MDPIANMIIMLKNAGASKHPSITVPFSKVKHAIAECLEKHGYLASVSKKTNKKGMYTLELGLVYNEAGEPKIRNVKRMSKPSRRSYAGVKDIYPVKNGYGMMVLSTPKGILSDKDARKEQVGGELLFTIV